MKQAVSILFFCMAVTCAAQDTPQLLGAIFQESAVLQRDVRIPIWGNGPPGETIRISLGGLTTETTSSEDGSWTATLPKMQAGGPFTLKVTSSGGAEQSVGDILIGDVYLCSGQSNMKLPVAQTANAETEISLAANARIRMLSVPNATNPTPLRMFPDRVSWQVASPKTVGSWSATCYYFAREMQKRVDVPFGLINSSWDGSNIRAWMDSESLSRVGGYESDLALLQLYASEPRLAQAAFGEKWQQWWRDNGSAGEAPWRSTTGAHWKPAPEGLGNYKEWPEAGLQQYHGMLWFRATAELTEEQAGHDAQLQLGPVDDIDQTWLNGHVVGNTFGWGTERTYPLTADILLAGTNVVVVNVLNTWDSGGMVGENAARAIISVDGSSAPLTDWRYSVPEGVGYPPRTPWQSVGGLSTIHNAMVAPLRDYGIRGVIWYQGESNAGEPDTYKELLKELMSQWRRQFGHNLPLLIVQLPNFGRTSEEPVESGWASLREAQRLAAQEIDRAGLAITIDIGEADELPPRNKQEVGRRLARAARNVVYGEEIPPSGPVALSATRSGETVHVSFGNVQRHLVMRDDSGESGFQLCGAERGSCHWAEAKVEGTEILLTATAKGSERVRYCWADNPVCPLYDESGLPAGPFELPVTKD